MAAPVDIERVVRRCSLDDLHGTFFLENDVGDSNASEGELNRNDKDPETRSFGRHETENVKEQYGKTPALRTVVSSDSEITATGIASGQEKISDSQDELDGLPPHVILLINNEEEEENKEELDVKVDVHHLPPSGDLRSSSDRLKDSADDTLNSFAARHCAGEKGVAAQGPTWDLSDVRFQRQSLPRSQTCPVITTSAFSRSQVIAVVAGRRGTDDSKTSVTYPLGFSHKWSLVLPSDVASQDASRLRSHTFSNAKDVQHLQQRQQQQQQQQQGSTLGETSPLRRGRSHSESDLHVLRLKGLGCEIRRMSDEFASFRSKRTLTTVREEDSDSSVDGFRYSSSFPGSAGTFYAHW